MTVSTPVIRKEKYRVSCAIPHRLGKVKWDDSEAVWVWDYTVEESLNGLIGTTYVNKVHLVFR